MVRKRYEINGVVQGVGFRPFVYKLANNLSLKGFVQNSSSGVKLELEGDEKTLDEFEKLFFENLPPLARVDKFLKKRVKPLYLKEQFEIKKSSSDRVKIALIPPDIKVCHECLKDISTFKNRFFRYFATNCTNCGPRYSIIQTVPYDRKNTSMHKFTMCRECQNDYQNPLNRRYHAQPIACQKCGPKIKLIVSNTKSTISENIFEKTAKLLKDGKIGAIKGVGGFHIVCDATNDKVINSLRKYKNRPTKPLAIMCKDVAQAKSIAKISKKELDILLSKEAPIVILSKVSSSLISSQVAPQIDRVGIMLPYTPLHILLFEFLDIPIVATSANLGGEPIMIDRKQIEQNLPFVDFIVDFDRDIVNAIDDSVVQVVDSDIMILRLARGYAPKVTKLPKKFDRHILSLGANQKSTISLAFEDNLILSPYIGDLDNIKSIEYLKRTIETFERFYDFYPDIVVSDKHPSYESTKLSFELKNKNTQLQTIQVQHHLAHLYSVKAEHGLKSKEYVGFIFDGTGLGDNNTLWGGEVFVKEKRKYYFKPIKLIGGEKAIKEPFRVALSLLFEKYTIDEVEKNFNYSNVKLLYNIWQKDLNCPKSSSVGRLFDGVASLASLIQKQTYEGEPGILCEMAYDDKICESFNFEITDNGAIEIKFDFFDKNIVSKFINTLVNIVIMIAKREKLDVIMSGGVFQNKTLLELILKKLKDENINYYYNKTIPINDSGISVGQIYSNLEKFKKEHK